MKREMIMFVFALLLVSSVSAAKLKILAPTSNSSTINLNHLTGEYATLDGYNIFTGQNIFNGAAPQSFQNLDICSNSFNVYTWGQDDGSCMGGIPLRIYWNNESRHLQFLDGNDDVLTLDANINGTIGGGSFVKKTGDEMSGDLNFTNEFHGIGYRSLSGVDTTYIHADGGNIRLQADGVEIPNSILSIGEQSGDGVTIGNTNAILGFQGTIGGASTENLQINLGQNNYVNVTSSSGVTALNVQGMDLKQNGVNVCLSNGTNCNSTGGSGSSFITDQINNDLNRSADVTFNTVNVTSNFEVQPDTDYGMNDMTIFEAGQDPNGYVDNTPLGLYWSNFDGGNGRFEFRTQFGNPISIKANTVNGENMFSADYIYASGPVYENGVQLSSKYIKNGNNATCFGPLCTSGDFNKGGVIINSSQGLRISGNGTGTNTLLTMCNENGTTGTTNIACLRWTGFSGAGRPELQAIYKDGTVKGIFEFRGGSSSSIFINAEDFVFYNNKRIAMLHANAPNGNGGTVQMMNINSNGEAQIGPTYAAVTSARWSVPRADFFGSQNNLTKGYWDWRMAVPGGSTITYARIDNTTQLNYYGKINGTNISAVNYFSNGQKGISRNISINNSAGTRCDMNFTGGLLVSSDC